MDKSTEPIEQERATAASGNPRRRGTKKPLVIRGAIYLPDIVLPWERELIAPALSSIEETADGHG